MSSKALAAAKAALDAPPPFVYNRGDAFASLSKDARDRLEAASPRAPPGQPEGVALSHMASPPSQKQSFFSLYGSPRRRLRTGVPDYATLALEDADSRARVALAARERGEPEPVSPEPAHAALLASFGEGPGGHGVHATFLTLSGDVDGSVTGGDSGEDLSNCSEGCADADVDAPATMALEAETLPPPPMVTESGVSLATARYHGHRTRRAAPSDTTRAKPSPRYKDATASTIINRTLTHLRLRAQRHEEGQVRDRVESQGSISAEYLVTASHLEGPARNARDKSAGYPSQQGIESEYWLGYGSLFVSGRWHHRSARMPSPLDMRRSQPVTTADMTLS